MRRWTSVAVIGLLVVLPVMALEWGVRALVASGRLPVAPSHSAQLDSSVVMLLDAPPRDVVILGDSQALTGVEPAVLAASLTDAAGREVSVFNFGQAGLDPAATGLLVELLERHDRLPSIAVVTVSSAAFGREGDVPIEPGEAPDAAARVLEPTALGRSLTGCGAVGELVERIDCELASVFAAWRWRGRPERLVAAVVDPAATDHGRTNAAAAAGERTRIRRRDDGYLARPPVAPAQLARQVDRFASRFTSIPRVVPAAADAYAALVERLEAAGVRVVLVGVPLTRPLEGAVEARLPGWNEARASATRALAEHLGRPIVQVDRYGDWWDARSAADANHLSAEGAVSFTRQLLEMPGFRDALVRGLRASEPP